MTTPFGRILTDAQIEQMAALREERGWSCARIARHFTLRGTPISEGAVQWQCLRVGADLPAQQRPRLQRQRASYRRGNRIVRAFTPEEDARLLALEASGLSKGAIARELGRGNNSINGRLYTLARHQTRQEEVNG